MTPVTPRTAEGRELVSYVGVTPKGLRVVAASHVERLVPAIEDAAARAQLEALRPQVRARAERDMLHVDWVDDLIYDALKGLGPMVRPSGAPKDAAPPVPLPSRDEAAEAQRVWAEIWYGKGGRPRVGGATAP